MITILHGDDIAASRMHYKQLQKKDTVVFDGEKVTPEEILQTLQTNSFFSEDSHIAIENFFTKRKPSKEMESITDILNKYSSEKQIFLWESKSLSKKMIGVFPKATDKIFTFPKSLFAFLDALRPQNTTQLLTLHHETIWRTDAEMVLVMLARQIRILLALTSEDSAASIDEISRMAPWQIKKLRTQSRLFSLEELKQIHAALFDLDVKSKSGGLSLPLPQAIDFFLLSI